MFKDYYKILNIGFDATYSEIKTSYEIIKSEYHPDSYKSKISKAMLLDAIEAHAILNESRFHARYKEEYLKFIENGKSCQDYFIQDYELEEKIYQVRKSAKLILAGVVLNKAGTETKEMSVGALFSAKREMYSGFKMYLVWIVIFSIFLLMVFLFQ